MTTKEDKLKQGQTMIRAAFRKRIQAQKLWDEAEEDLAKGRALVLEAEGDNG